MKRLKCETEQKEDWRALKNGVRYACVKFGTRETLSSSPLIAGLGQHVYILVVTQFRSRDDSFGWLQLFRSYILSCTQLSVTNCTIVTTHSNHMI